MPDISVDFGGVELQTPFLIAAGPKGLSIGEVRSKVKKIAENGWGALVTKTLASSPFTHPPVRPHLWTTKRFRGLGMQNLGPPMVRFSKKEMVKLKGDINAAHKVGLKIIVSIVGGSFEEWRSYAREAEEVGADGVELNLSCPVRFFGDVTEERMGGYLAGQSPEVTKKIVAAVKGACSIPVIPKLTAQAMDIGVIASACEEADADALSLINAIQGIIGVDINTGRPVPSDALGNAYITGISGPIIRPIGLKNVALAALKTKLPISGVGGIEDHGSALEYLLLGASTIQVCTVVMWRGLKIGKRIADGVMKYMEDQGYSTLKDFVGNSLRYIKLEPVKGSLLPLTAVVDTQSCTACGKCYISCNEMASDAIRKANSRFYVDVEVCDGCGLCKVVCPQEALKF